MGRGPRVSTVLPTHDRAEMLRRAVTSVVEQTHGNVELIVVDDHSSVPAGEVLEDVPTETLTSFETIRHGENRGANAARNTGIEAATGELIAFLDDDDWWEPTKVEKQVERFESSHDRVGVVYTGKRVHTDGGTKIRVHEREGDISKRLLLGNFIGSFSTIMVRREAIEESGLPDERLPNAQDWEWYVRLSQDWEFASVPEPLINYREDGEGEQISDDFEKRKDVSYPLIVEKHRSVAREYGYLFERKMLGHISFHIAHRALRRKEFSTARRHALAAVVSYPFRWEFHVLLVGSLFGKQLTGAYEALPRDARRRLTSFARKVYFGNPDGE